MAYDVKILADNISPDGVRLTTMEVTLPRIVLAEFNTHRMFSRNSASSRAIPVEKMLNKVQQDPFIPIYWGLNQKGMQADQELAPEDQEKAQIEWLKARDNAITQAKIMLDLGIHKQITNRLLEPWLWHTIIVTATEWENFFALRLHKDAQPEIRKAAVLMKSASDTSKPKQLCFGEWHLPLVSDRVQLLNEGYTLDDLCKISIGRCARVSYLTHDGKRDPKADIELMERLCKSGHMSPLEHVATPAFYGENLKFFGNFKGWQQYRKMIVGEDVYKTVPSV